MHYNFTLINENKQRLIWDEAPLGHDELFRFKADTSTIHLSTTHHVKHIKMSTYKKNETHIHNLQSLITFNIFRQIIN